MATVRLVLLPVRAVSPAWRGGVSPAEQEAEECNETRALILCLLPMPPNCEVPSSRGAG